MSTNSSRHLRRALYLALATGTGGVLARSYYQYSTSRRALSPSTFSQPLQPGQPPIKTDVLVVGTGAAALTAALRCRVAGLTVIVVEKSDKVGGTTTYSGSGLWIPNTHVHKNSEDSPEEALQYLEHIVGSEEKIGPASSTLRKRAFLENGPKMVRWLESIGFAWHPTKNYPDYFPEAPGGKSNGGRSIESGMFDLNLLGPWKAMLNINPTRAPLPARTYELSKLVRAKVSWEGMLTAAKVWGIRTYPQIVLGSDYKTLGVAMIGQLLYLNLGRDVAIWTKSPMKSLVVNNNGRVTGAIISREGEELEIEASKGVLLAAGGFAKNAAMRQKHQAAPITSDWTSVIPTDQGDAISAAVEIGAATALLEHAWWGAAMRDPKTGQPFWCLYDRVLPHSIIVDQTGQRYTNESQNYNSIGRSIWERNKTAPAIPSYLILDTQHRDRYVLASKFLPGKTPQEAFDSGFVIKADTLPKLADKINLPGKSFQETVERFNHFVSEGVDEDFHRGASAYDRFMGDPTYTRNPNLGSISKGPFYAVQVWPGDLGTKGGILTDEHARALKEVKGTGGYEVIEGLYACGNSSASVMGETYAGAGATLGPALTFGYIAAEHIIGL